MTTIQRTNNFQWGDIGEEDDLDFPLPPRELIGPDQNGEKTVIEYRFNEEGKIIKVTKRTRVQKRVLSQKAAERRSWPKFGDAARGDTGLHLTVRSTEDIHLERLNAPGLQAEEATTSGDSMSQASGSLMVCRLCRMRGDHWTARCPQRDLLSLMETPLTTEASTTSSEAYVPPSRRKGADIRSTRNDENSVRVTNLSEDAREQDLMELFSAFGAVTRAYVVLDKNTSMSRGFGFVNFVSREDAQRAINNLNGYGYDSLILRVEWATPRPT